MPVLGLVLTLPADPQLSAQLSAQLALVPGLSLGVPQPGHRLPAVLCSDTRAEDKARWNHLHAMPGLLHIELVSADFSDLPPAQLASGAPSASRRDRNRPSSSAQ